jgi:hypothetical protein
MGEALHAEQARIYIDHIIDKNTLWHGVCTLNIEFLKIMCDGTEEIIETKLMSISDKNCFEEWAQRALSARRCDNYLGAWPDEIRATGPDGQVYYRWPLRNEAPALNCEPSVVISA